MAIKITPLSDKIGAEISGLDLTRPLDDDEVAAIKAAWRDHLVLLFRDQKLSEPDQIRFAQYLGTPQEYPRDRWSPLADNPDMVLVIGNVKVDGKLAGTLPDGELTQHSDSLWLDMPPKGTSLYAIEVPKSRGETIFANMYAAFELMPPDAAAKLANAKAVYSYNVGARYLGDEMGDPNEVGNVHPAVVAHPLTGRQAIFVNSLMTSHLEGMDPEESKALLQAAYDAAADPSIRYEHHWRPGDFLIWDNWCTQHARNDFDHSERRLLKRITIEGESRPSPAKAA